MVPNAEASALGDTLGNALRPFQDLESQDGGADAAVTPTEGDFVVRDGQVLLRGSRSASSGVEAFPARPICPQTGARDMEPALFGPHGTLYSFSTVHVSATRAVPYTLGYVDFPSGLRAFAHVRAVQEDLRCDMPVTLRAEEGVWWVEPRTEPAP